MSGHRRACVTVIPGGATLSMTDGVLRQTSRARQEAVASRGHRFVHPLSHARDSLNCRRLDETPPVPGRCPVSRWMATAVLFAGLTFFVGVLGNRSLHGAESSNKDASNQSTSHNHPSSTEVRFLRLPARDIAQRVTKDWQPVRRAEFESILREANSQDIGPGSVQVKRAEYRAVFDGQSLRAGRMTLNVQQLEQPPGWLSLGACNLALSELQAEGNKAGDKDNRPRENDTRDNNTAKNDTTGNANRRSVIWGTDRRGRVLAGVAPGVEQLIGRWSLGGTHVGQDYRFDLSLVPAASSTLRISVPNGWTLKASAGNVRRSPHDSGSSRRSADLQEWIVLLSDRHRVTLTLSRVLPTSPAEPVILLHSDVLYGVRESDLQVQYQADLNVLHAPVHELRFRLPREVDVYSVVYGGETPLPFQTRLRGKERQVVVELPDPLQGRSRPVTLHAVGPVRAGQPWNLPGFRLENVLFLSGEVHVHVDRPLQLQSYTPQGLRQSSAISDKESGETLSFRQERVDGRLQIEVSHPRSDQTGRVISHIDVRDDRWTVASELTWSIRSGTMFDAKWRLSSGWNVTRVLLIDDTGDKTDNGSPQALSWREGSGKKGPRKKGLGNQRQRVVSVKLPEAVAAGGSVRLRVVASSRLTGERRRLRLPVILPENVSRLRSTVFLSHAFGSEPKLLEGATYDRVSRGSLPQSVQTSSWARGLLNGGGTPQLFLMSRASLPHGIVALERHAGAFDARAWAAYRFRQDHFHEEFSLTIRPRGDVPESILVYLSQPGPELTWQRLSPGQRPSLERIGTSKSPPKSRQNSNRVTGLPAKLVNRSAYPRLQLPEEGELWEVRLAPAPKRPMQIVARRTRRCGKRVQPAMISLPQARQFEGVFEVHATDITDIQTDAAAVADVAELLNRRPAWITSLAEPERLWQYRRPDVDVTIQRKIPSSASNVTAPASLELWSVLTPSSSSRCLHRAVYRLEEQPLPARFRFTLPDEAAVQTVTVNRQSVVPRRENEMYVVGTMSAHQTNIVEIRYTTPSISPGWQPRQDISVPETSRKVLSFQWHVALPQNVRLLQGPDLTTTQAAPQVVFWTKRLLGPLARSSNVGLFHPLHRSAWTGLFSANAGTVHHAEQPLSADWPPHGWTTYDFAGPDVLHPLTLKLLHRDAMAHLAWIAMLLCLTTGWGIRRLQWSGRGRFGAWWLSACLAIAILVPAEWAELAGGCLLGSLMAALTPRRLLRPRLSNDPSRSAVPHGSTASFPSAALPGLWLFLCTALFVASLIGVPVAASQQVETNGAEPSSTSGKDDDAQTVLVPSDGPRDDSDRPAIVYVRRALLDKLRGTTSEQFFAPQFLIRNARYHITAEDTNSADVTARFRVMLLTPRRATDVALPLTGAHLCGATACHVNGRVQPVRRHAQNGTFLIRIPPQFRDRSGNRASSSSSPWGTNRPHGRRSVRNVQPRAPALATPPRRTRLQQTSRLQETSRRGIRPVHAAAGSLGVLAQSTAPQRTAPVAVDIRLCLRVPIRRTAAGVRLAFGIPAVASNGIELKTARDDRHIDIDGLSNAVEEAEPTFRRLSGVVGPRRRLTVDWSTLSGEGSARSPLTAQVGGLVELRPSHLRYRYRVQYDASYPVHQLEWRIPHRWNLRTLSLAGSGPDGEQTPQNLPYDLLRGDGNTHRLRINLPSEHSRPFVIAAEFVVPNIPQSALVRISLPRLHQTAHGAKAMNESKKSNQTKESRDANPEAPPIRELPHRIALLAAAEYNMDVLSNDLPAIKPLNEEARREIRSLFSGARLRPFAYEVSRPVVLRGKLTPKSPQRTVQQTHVIDVFRDRLRWKMTADVKTNVALAYQHVVILPPRFYVDSVAVIEDKAPRLVRWTRKGNRLVLFLSDKTAGRQTVTITGELQIANTTDLRLPDIRFRNATATSSRLWLYRHRSVGVGIDDTGEAVSADVTPPAAEEERFLVAALECPAGGRMPRIRVRPRSESLTVQRLTTLTQSDDAGWQLMWTLRLKDEFPPTGIVVRIPSALAERATLTGDEWTIERRDRRSDVSEWILTPKRNLTPAANGKTSTPPPVSVRLQVDDYQPERPQGTVPVPGVRGATVVADYLAVSKKNESGRRFHVDPPAIRVATADVPSWIRRRVPGSHTDVFRKTQGSWQLSRQPYRNGGAEISIPLMETDLWQSEAHGTYGQTGVWIVAGSDASLTFRWPQWLALRQVQVNGTRRNSQPDEDGRLTVRLTSETSHFIRIDWHQKSPKHFPAIAGQQVPLPTPLRVSARRSMVRMAVPTTSKLMRFSGAESLSGLSQRLERMEQLLRIMERGAAADFVSQLAFQTARQELAGVKEHVRNRPADQAALDEKSLDRLDRIETTLAEWQQRWERSHSPDTDAGRLPPPTASIPLFTAAPERVWHGRLPTEGKSAPHFWFVDRDLSRGLVALVVFVVAVGIAGLVFRLQPGELLARWEALSWALLGFLWWLFLAPGVVGPVLLLVAVVKALGKLRRPRETNVVHIGEPSGSQPGGTS